MTTVKMVMESLQCWWAARSCLRESLRRNGMGRQFATGDVAVSGRGCYPLVRVAISGVERSVLPVARAKCILSLLKVFAWSVLSPAGYGCWRVHGCFRL